jgi:hypothetical protein
MVMSILASALVATACNGSGSQRDGSTPVTCAWATGSSCWKDVAAAAVACTDPTATGTFDVAQNTCTYADGTLVHIDPAALVTSLGATMDVTVVASTAARCAHFVASGKTRSLTTRLGTFTADFGASPAEYTCPDGTRFHVEDPPCTAGGVGFTPPLTPSLAFQQSGLVTFGFYTERGTLWRCQGAPFDLSRPTP